jgi:hypothetical protein
VKLACTRDDERNARVAAVAFEPIDHTQPPPHMWLVMDMNNEGGTQESSKKRQKYHTEKPANITPNDKTPI